MFSFLFFLSFQFTFGIRDKHKWSQIYKKVTLCKADDGIKHPLDYLCQSCYHLSTMNQIILQIHFEDINSTLECKKKMFMCFHYFLVNDKMKWQTKSRRQMRMNIPTKMNKDIAKIGRLQI